MLANIPRAAALMDEAGLDGLVATRLENVFYLSGVWNTSQVLFPFTQQCYVVLAREHLDKPVLVISTGDWDQALPTFPNMPRMIHFGTFYRELPRDGESLVEREQYLKEQTIDRAPAKDALEALIVALNELGLAGKRVGIDESTFNPVYFPDLERREPALQIQHAASLLSRIRWVKTPAEVERLRRAAAVTEQALRASTAIARPGVTEREMLHEFNRSIVSAGGEPAFAMVRFGRNAAVGQMPAEATPLQPGDHIWFDVGCRVDGYWADLARIYCLGEPSAKLQKYYQAVLAGEEYEICEVHPGMTAGQVFDETVEVVRANGLPHYRRQHVGHAIGVEVYDQPVLAPGQTIAIEAGMVLNFETPYYELAWGAVHIEDPVVINADGKNEVLTTLSRGIGIIPL
jgi:Xaa-Pro dipeptidase